MFPPTPEPSNFLVYYTMVGDGGSIREVHVRLVRALTRDGAMVRLHEWFGKGYAFILKVEQLPNA